MLNAMRWVEFGPQGWVRVGGFETGVMVLAKTYLWEGRRVITGLHVSADRGFTNGVTASMVKAIPVGWLESAINTPEAMAWLDERQEEGESDPTDLALWHRKQDWYRLSGHTPFTAEDVPALSRPHPNTPPDVFYRQVAGAYTAAIATSQKPAPLIAERAGVPVPTVHRWIAEARRRGHLPPARKGRAG
jgi:hypothetical protein